MKILHVGNAASVFVPNWARHFARRGDEVHIISYEPAEIEGVQVHILTPHPSQKLQILSGVSEIRELCRKVKPDVVHAHYTTKHAFLAALADYHPLIVQVWGSDVLVESEKDEGAMNRTRLTLDRADAVVCASKYLRDYVGANHDPSTPTILRAMEIGIDLSIFNGRGVGERGKEFVVFSPRGKSPHYRQENIEEAVRSLITTDHNVDYLCLQNGEHLPTEVMADRYQCSDAVVSIPYTDQFSSCLQEAMACGCVPIVADLPAYHQHLKHGWNARYVSAEAKPEEIAREIVWCIEHPEEREVYAKRNREIAEREFDWNECIKKYEELYEEVAHV